MQNHLGAVDDGDRQTGEAGDLDAVAAVGGAGDHSADEDDFVVPLFYRHREIAEAGEVFFELGQLLVMRREERAGAAFGVAVEVLDHGPGDGQAVVGRGAAADLVQDDQGAIGGVVEDVGGLVHLDHEGRVAAGEVVAGADAGEDAVHEADAAGFGGGPAADLGEEGDERDLADVGRFTGHVGAGDERELGVGRGEEGVVGDEARGAASGGDRRVLEHLLHDGVAAFDDFEGVAFVEDRLAVVPLAGEDGPAGEDVEFGEGVGGAGEGDGFVEDGGDEGGEEGLFAGEGVFLGVEDFFFFGAEVFGDVALAVHGGLAADVVGRDEVEVGLGDLDVVAEIVREFDLQAADAGALLFAAFEVGEPGLVVGRERAEAVELGAVAGADVVAVGEVVREGVGEGRRQELQERRQLL